ncbi:MAG TPA: hypothetical protein VFC19_28300, partial [Candidatus Limnocylindrales bacterium]|nr:hypothetical protein [Candidatus Limnocylindrales bacterium]
MAYLDGLSQWGDRDTFDRVLCDRRRDALQAQAARFTDAYRQQAALWGVTFILESGPVTGDEDTSQPELTLQVPVIHTHEKPGG